MAEAKGKEGIQFRLKWAAEGKEQTLSSLAGPAFPFENRGDRKGLTAILFYGLV